MNISAAFIRRPIATGMLMAAILLLGLISCELLPVAASRARRCLRHFAW